MGSDRRGKREHDFDITGQFDDALGLEMVGESHAAQPDIVFGRDADFSVDFQAGMVLPFPRMASRTTAAPTDTKTDTKTVKPV
jgi:hypothetical protein